MTDVMVDIETLDTRPSAVILSIGAVALDWNAEAWTNPFYSVIDSESCKEIGLTESVGTRLWWDKQGPEAREVFTAPNVNIYVALHDFAMYLKQFGKDVKLWGNGSDFDNTIIANAYEAINLDAPWRFYNNRCYRTITKSLSFDLNAPPRHGVYHNALDDAKHQAMVLLQLKDRINHD